MAIDYEAFGFGALDFAEVVRTLLVRVERDTEDDILVRLEVHHTAGLKKPYFVRFYVQTNVGPMAKPTNVWVQKDDVPDSDGITEGEALQNGFRNLGSYLGLRPKSK